MLANHTAGLSGADIEELVTDAKRNAARQDARRISFGDFPAAEEFDTDRKDIEVDPTTDRDLHDPRDIDSFPEDHFDDDPTVGFR